MPPLSQASRARTSFAAARPALDPAVIHTFFEVDRLIHALVERFADLLVFRKRQRFERQPALDAQGDQLARNLIRVAERQALCGDEVIGAVGRVDEALRRGAAHVFLQDTHRFQHRDKRREAQAERIDRVEYGLLVLLHVLVVGERQALHHREQRREVSEHAPALAADQLRNVRVFLLRHDARAGGKRVVQLDEFEFPRAPEDDLLRKAGKVYHRERYRRGDLRAEIAVRHAVQAVAADRREAEQLRREITVERIGCAGERAGAERTDVHALHGVLHAADVPQEHLGIRHQVVPEGDRLRALQMRVAGHDRVGVFLRLVAEDGNQLLELADEARAFPAQRQADIERDLIVAAARRVQALARVADAGGQLALDEGVNILRVRVDMQRAAFNIRSNFFKLRADFVALALRDDAAGAKHRRVRDAALNILFDHPAVHRNRRIEIVRFRIRLLLEAPFPQLHFD